MQSSEGETHRHTETTKLYTRSCFATRVKNNEVFVWLKDNESSMKWNEKKWNKMKCKI